MAANNHALNNYFNDVLFIQDAAVRAALNSQGLDAFDTFATLTDQDIKDICRNARSPGGTVVNPRAGEAGQQPTLPNRGVNIGLLHEKQLRMLRYFCFHMHRIQRDATPQNASVPRLIATWKLYEQEKEHDNDDVKLPDPIKKIEGVRAAIENLDDVLNRRKGASGAPLAYITREHVTLPGVAPTADEEDPGFAQPDEHAELVRRTRHDGSYFTQDKIAVWHIVRHMSHGGPVWNWIQAFARGQDGRQAYNALKSHYLGASFTSKIKSNADSIIETTVFDGRSRTFKLEGYFERLQGAFTDLADNGEPYPPASKVRKLLSGIHDPTLEVAKAMVLAHPDMNTDFDKAINFISDYASNTTAMARATRNISSISADTSSGFGGRGGRGGGRGSHGGGRGGRGGRGRGGRGRGGGTGGSSSYDSRNPDTYLDKEAWQRLTPEQKQKARDARAQKGIGSSNKRSISALASTTETNNNSADPQDQDTSGDVGEHMNRRPRRAGN